MSQVKGRGGPRAGGKFAEKNNNNNNNEQNVQHKGKQQYQNNKPQHNDDLTEQGQDQENKGPFKPRGERKPYNPDNANKGPKREPRPGQDDRKIGLVRGVVSGDTLLVLDLTDIEKRAASNTSEPKDIQLTLLGLKAPTLGRRYADDPEKKLDMPYAWESREYLRKRVIGKTIVYRVEHDAGGRQYGEAWLEQENLRFSIVENGFADVIERTKPKREFDNDGDDHSRLESAKHDAQHGKKGMWGGADNKHVRKVHYREAPRGSRGEDLYGWWEKNQGKQLKGIVEQVISGSTLRVYLPDSYDEFQLQLAGVRCPQYKSSGSEPFGLEAKFFTEHVLLNRDVTVVLDTIDQYNTVFGTVQSREGNVSLNLLAMGLATFVEWSVSKKINTAQYKEAEKKAQDALLRIWSQKQPPKPVLPGGDQQNEGGRGAQGKAGGQQNETFTGPVVEIVNAGTLIVRMAKGDKSRDRKLRLSSIRPLKMPQIVRPTPHKDGKDGKDAKDAKDAKTEEAKEEKQEAPKDETDEAKAARETKETEAQEKKLLQSVEEAYALEAKEWLRSTLIGKQVRCVFDYIRGFDNNEPTLFWSVYVGDQNIAVELVKRGYAYVVSHGRDEPRSGDYQSLTLAEKSAKKSGKGVHGPYSKKPIIRINDLTLANDANKSKQFLPFLKRAGRVSAVVEHVFSSTRYKLYIPSEGCMINFSVVGAQTEKPFRTEGDSKQKAQETTFMKTYPPVTAGNRALAFARDHIYQRNVEISVENTDKGGNFLGQIFADKKDFAVTLLSKGHARYSQYQPDFRTKDYADAAKQAETAKLGFYGSREGDTETPTFAPRPQKARRVRGGDDDDEEDADVSSAPGQDGKNQKVSEPFNVAITEIHDGSSFSFQKIGESTTSLSDMMTSFQKQDWKKLDPLSPTRGQFIAAHFTVDNLWYRAQVVKAIYPADYKPGKDVPTPNVDKWEVEYIDYGNKEVLKADRIRALPKDFDVTYLDRQAHAGKLVFVRAPALDEEFGKDAATYFKELVWGKTLRATQHFIGQKVAHLSLGDPDSKISINAEMIMRGLARVDNGKKKRRGDGPKPSEFLRKLQEEESKAHDARMNIWQYGHPPDSDDEREESTRLR